jgi:hypothetical protein
MTRRIWCLDLVLALFYIVLFWFWFLFRSIFVHFVNLDFIIIIISPFLFRVDGEGSLPDGAESAPQPLPNTPSPLTLRTKMVATPLFIGRLPVNSSGRARVTWKVPDNIAKFEIRVYAISKSGT